jgi:dUTPase
MVAAARHGRGAPAEAAGELRRRPARCRAAVGSRVVNADQNPGGGHGAPEGGHGGPHQGGHGGGAPPDGAVPVLVKRLDAGLPLPARAHPGDAGVDLYAAEDVTLAPGRRSVVRTGLAIALPDGYAGFVHPRSGLAARHGVTVVNAPGTVDAG